MKEEIKHAAVAVNHAVTHSPVSAWWGVFITYIQTTWLEWGSVTADIVSWILGTSLTVVLLANHSITLYKSIKNNESSLSDDKQDKQG